MRLYLSLLLWSCVALCSGVPKFSRRNVHGMLGAPPLTNDPLPPDHWFTQLLDHFEPTTSLTWLQTDTVIESGALSYLGLLLQNPRPNVMKEAAWTISNITAGNVRQIQEVVKSGLLLQLISVLEKITNADSLDKLPDLYKWFKRLDILAEVFHHGGDGLHLMA